MPDFSIDALVRAIQDGVDTDSLTMDGQEYFTRTVYLPPKEETIETLKVQTLQAIVDYLSDSSPDGMDDLFIHVSSPTEVKVYSPAQGRRLIRHEPIVADCDGILGKGKRFAFGAWHSVEQMIINLQSMFASTEDRETILRVIGNLRDEKVSTFADDGVTQGVTTRLGIARAENTAVPNPVVLRPYRTFREVDQPDSEFIFRMQPSNKTGDPPSCALFEADGGGWQLEAIQAVAKFLKDNCDDVLILA